MRLPVPAVLPTLFICVSYKLTSHCVRNLRRDPAIHTFFSAASRSFHASPTTALNSRPSRTTVLSYPTVSIRCITCNNILFRYKKKNGTKSNLVKCYYDRIVEDSAGLLAQSGWCPEKQDVDFSWECPVCQSNFARPAKIYGRPALKMAGGKVRMQKR